MTSDVLISLWFDTEDFINPESDDIPSKICEIMERHHVKVTFKIVGEKLRALKERARTEVIEAMGRHDIGYHSNYHSVHPTISEYVGNLEWDEAADKFLQREKSGVEEIRNTYGRDPSCYGHPSLCWVPEAYPALLHWKIPVYLDETNTITSPLKERPYYYCNILNIMGLGQKTIPLDASDGPARLPADHLVSLIPRIQWMYNELQKSDAPEILSMYCHPTTYATENFWDIVNFARGKNPPKERYERSQIKSWEQTALDLERLEKFVVYLASLPGARFITASEAGKIYADRARDHEFTIEEISQLCETGKKAIAFQELGGMWVSAAEILSLVVLSLAHYSRTGQLPKQVKAAHPLGPKKNPPSSNAMPARDSFLEACTALSSQLAEPFFYLPSAVSFSGAATLSLEDFFATCCAAYLQLAAKGELGPTIPLVKGNFEVGKFVTDEGAKTDWVKTGTNPEGFSAPRQVELARLQTWTLKPAVADLSSRA